MSSFKETVENMGYEITTQDKDNILIVKRFEIADAVILFNNVTKTMSGAVNTKKMIYNLDQICEQYAIFRAMRSDLKTLQQLSKYDIID